MVLPHVVSSGCESATVGGYAVQCMTGRGSSGLLRKAGRAHTPAVETPRLPAPVSTIHRCTRNVRAAGVSVNPSAAPTSHGSVPHLSEDSSFHCNSERRATRTSDATCKLLGWPRLHKNSLPPVRFLGSGVFGHVFLSDDPRYTEPVAVKMVDKALMLGGHAYCQKTRLQKEARMLESLKHVPNVVQLKGLFEDERYGYIAMELCDKGDVEHYLNEFPGPMQEEKAGALFSQMLNAVHQVHNHGICYGDIKPENFLLQSASPSSTGGLGLQVKLADFGCSQEYSDDDFLTQRTGTPLYTAPEVYLGRYSQAADLWGMGMILYRMLSGVFPFCTNLDKLPPYAMMMSVLNDELSFEGKEWAEVSCEAKDLVFHLLQRCVDRRTTAAAALGHPWLTKNSICAD